ncbi:MAG: carbohydrate ABC transporter permease [Spirochaetaceae bacterium]|jgi:raffinose/stachyose/melibiose transport system permease protein|nr:carbohydrate ABC transporter permease [Spirochaetaceae bacterium]
MKKNTAPLRKIVFNVVMYAVLSIIALYTLFPLFILLLNSFKPHSAIVANPIAFPNPWNFDYLAKAVVAIHFIKSFFITALISITSVALIVLASSLAGWIMVRAKTIYMKILFYAFTAAMLIPFQAVMYPLLSFFDSMYLKNIPGLIIMYGGFGLSLSVFLYHGFVKSVPASLEEAAVLDGAGVFQVVFNVVLPLLKGTTSTVIILNAMWIWNDYLLPFLVIGNGANRTLTLELYFAKLTSGQYGNPWELIFPAVLVTIIPIIIIFLFLQRYIVKGVTAGAVKQ